MFPVTITLHNTQQMSAVLAALGVDSPKAVATAQETAAVTTTKAAKAPTAAPTVAPTVAPTPAPTQAATSAPTPPSAEAAADDAPAESVTFLQLSQAVTRLVKERDRDTAVAILQGFGLGRVSEAGPEQYAPIYAAVQEALNAKVEA